MLTDFVAELHTHTVLSPCAAVEMIPPLIVRQALARGIRLLAITDHNASANVGAVQAAAAGTGLTVLPGMELQTQEDVHVLCLFDTLDQLQIWQTRVDGCLPEQPNVVAFWGEQFVVDATGDFIRREERLLLTAARLPFDTAVREVSALGGLALPAHVDRQAFGLLAHLAFVPEALPVKAVEISRFISPAEARRRFPQLQGQVLVQGGDAHLLDDLAGLSTFRLAAPTISEIVLALQESGGRSCRPRSPET
jgi:3',5'-nucleoside bisphosphate phosphatase